MYKIEYIVRRFVEGKTRETHYRENNVFDDQICVFDDQICVFDDQICVFDDQICVFDDQINMCVSWKIIHCTVKRIKKQLSFLENLYLSDEEKSI